jgi:hypothetical protein
MTLNWLINKGSGDGSSRNTSPSRKQNPPLKFTQIFFDHLYGLLFLALGGFASRLSAGLLCGNYMLWRWNFGRWRSLRSVGLCASASILLLLLAGIFFYRGLLCLRLL